MLAIKAVIKDGLIKPLEAIDLPEDEEIVVYISEEKVEEEEYSDWTEEEWQRFSLHGFENTEDDKDVDWEDFFNVEKKKRIKYQEETGFAKEVLGNEKEDVWDDV